MITMDKITLDTPEAPVCHLTDHARRVLAQNGYKSHVDAQGRLWATYMWSTRDYIGETTEVLTHITYADIRGWMGY